MSRFTLIFVLLIASPAIWAADTGQPSPTANSQDRHAFVLFAEAYSHQIKSVDPSIGCDDLKFLGAWTRDARIVGVGESRHSAHEFLQLKRRLVQCLITKHGFTNVLIEAGLPYTMRLNAYIQGGDGDPEQLVSGMAYWSLYQNDEFVGLLKWLKEYNAAVHGAKVRLLGIDMQDPVPGLEATLTYIRRVDAKFFDDLQKRNGNFGIYRSAPNVLTLAGIYKKLSPGKFKALVDKLTLIDKRLNEEKSAYIAASSDHEYFSVVEQFHTVMQAHRMFATVRDAGFSDLFVSREKALADNVEWQVENGGDNAKYILLSHNNHVAKSTVYGGVPGGMTKNIEPLGMAIAKHWPGKYVAFATTYFDATGRWKAWRNDAAWEIPKAPSDTVDDVLTSTGDKLFALDLGDLAPGSPAKAWASEKHLMRSEGGMSAIVPIDAYDAYLFVHSISQANFTDGAIRRFEAM
ncbi:MAG TPA: erythromycin esterase family protein, partial [Pseudomonadales bacterium]|nr:erythromycin esterase family protein [Pseudomonadales bacterium]